MDKLRCPYCGKVELEFVEMVYESVNSDNEYETNDGTDIQEELYECSYCGDSYIKNFDSEDPVTFVLVMPDFKNAEEEKEEWLEQHYI